MKNYWDEFEYNKLKLLLHEEKIKSIRDVLHGNKEYDDHFPISVELHLTNLCNLNCPWCTDKILRQDRATLEKDIIFGLISELAEKHVGITLEGGGEPTLHPDFSEIVRYGYSRGAALGLITNGTQDISDTAGMLKWIRVSLDASTASEYTVEKGVERFEHVLQNLQKICLARDEQQTYVGVGYVLTRNNYGYLEELLERLDRTGVDYVYFRPVEEAKEVMPSVAELYELKKKLVAWTENKRIKYQFHIADRIVDCNANLPCIAHSLTSIIHADGNVTMCEKRRNETVIFGNIREHSFSQIWDSKIRKDVSKKLLNPAEQSGCSVCRITAFNQIIDNLEHLNTKEFI